MVITVVELLLFYFYKYQFILPPISPHFLCQCPFPSSLSSFCFIPLSALYFNSFPFFPSLSFPLPLHLLILPYIYISPSHSHYLPLHYSPLSSSISLPLHLSSPSSIPPSSFSHSSYTHPPFLTNTDSLINRLSNDITALCLQ